MRFLICLITGCLLIVAVLALSACASPCWSARDIESRTDCNAFGQVIAGLEP